MRKLAKRGNMNERIDVALHKFRSRMSSYPPGMCPLAMYRSFLQMSMNQSCGKCIPCRDGLVEGESLQWPCPDKTHPGTPIMHVGKPARGRALFYPAKYVPSAELPDETYPYLLTTGRILYHYNAAAMTARSKGLVDMAGEGFIEINYRDADKLGIVNGERICVKSRRGSITATARVGRKVSEGETWMPFHFPDSPVNQITNAALDEFARIPEYKVCAVQLEKKR